GQPTTATSISAAPDLHPHGRAVRSRRRAHSDASAGANPSSLEATGLLIVTRRGIATTRLCQYFHGCPSLICPASSPVTESGSVGSRRLGPGFELAQNRSVLPPVWEHFGVASGRSCALLLFPDEGHGLTASTNIQAALH